MTSKYYLALFIVLMNFFLPVSAQKCDYARLQLSPKGTWVTWVANYGQDDDSLILKNRISGKSYVFPFHEKSISKVTDRGRTSFSKDENYFTFPIGNGSGTAILQLITGTIQEIKQGYEPKFSEDGKFLAIKILAKGSTNLQVIRLQDGHSQLIPNISYEWSFNNRGSHILYSEQTPGSLRKKIMLRELYTGNSTFINEVGPGQKDMIWNEKGDEIQFVSTDPENKNTDILKYVLKTGSLHKLAGSDDFQLPAGRSIDPHSYTFEDRERRVNQNRYLFFSLKMEQSYLDSVNRNKGNNLSPVFSIPWNSHHGLTTCNGVFDMRQRRTIIYPISDEELILSNNYAYAIVQEKNKYTPFFKETYADIYLVNTSTGVRTLLLKKYPRNLNSSYLSTLINFSPDERFVVYYQGGHWWSYQIDSEKRRSLTQQINAGMEDTSYDQPGIKPPYGLAGWSKDGKNVLLNSQFDVFAIRTDATAFCQLTDGTQEKKVYRIDNPAEARFAGVAKKREDKIDLTSPLPFTIRGSENKFNGYAVLYRDKIKELHYGNYFSGYSFKSKDANVYAFLQERFNEPPLISTAYPSDTASKTLWKPAGKWISKSRGKSELIQYTSTLGRRMQGALYYPADYDPARKYPMLVQIYELQSASVNQFAAEDAWNNDWLVQYTRNGYFVFRPDIFFQINDPGFSAVNCIVPAVEKVIATGLIDKNAIGLMGGSWGGYLTAFLITQTNIFRAAIAIAPITDLVTMSLTERASNPLQLFEAIQGRMAGPFYEQKDAYIRNSPIYYVKNIQTPLLLIHGEEDIQVGWQQSMYMQYAMYRAGKPCLFLLYKGENHGITNKPENKSDAFRKRLEYFDHFLKGAPAAQWINFN